MSGSFMIFAICLATYTAVNADSSAVLDNDGKPANLGTIRTTGRGLGTTTNLYENSQMTDNYQNVPQQNNRANNGNSRQKRRNRRRNNNRRYSQSYGSPSPSYNNNDWNNHWDNYQPVVAAPLQPPPTSPFDSNWDTYWDNYQPVMTQPMPYPPPPPPPMPYPPPPQMHRMNYNTNVPFSGFNNNYNNYNDNGNMGYDNGLNFSNRPSIQINDDGVVVNGHKIPIVLGTQGVSVNFNENNELIINGQKIPVDAYNGRKTPVNLSNRPNIHFNGDKVPVNGQKIPKNSGTQGATIKLDDNNELIINGQQISEDAYTKGNTPGDWVIHGSNIGNVNSGKINEDNTSAEPQLRCIPYKGLNFMRNNCYYDGSPNISLYDGGVVIDGKKIPMDIDRTVNPTVTFDEKDGFTVNGIKVPADAEGNPLNPTGVDGSGKTPSDRVPSKNNVGNLNSNNENSFSAFKSRKGGQQGNRRKQPQNNKF